MLGVWILETFYIKAGRVGLATGLEKGVFKRRQNRSKDFMGMMFDSSSHAADLLKGSRMNPYGTEDRTTFNFNKFL